MKHLNLHSLRTKIILSIAVIATLFLGAFQAYAYFTLKAQMLHELNESADQKIERLSRDLDLPMWELDESWIETILKSELMNEEVHAIIVSGDQNILVSVDRDVQEQKHEEENVIIRSRPILHNGVKIGAINLYLTRDLMESKLLKELKSTLVVTIFESIVVISFLWIMLQRVVLSPIEALMASTKRIAEGDYTHAPSKFAHDEIAALSTSIYQMQNKIQTRENEILLRQEELKNLKERLEYAINGAQDGLWDWNLETNEVYFSPRWKEMLGYTDDELPNSLETWNNLMHPDDLKKAYQDVETSHKNPNIYYENIHRLRHKNGSMVWILTRGQTIFNSEGKPVRMVGFHTDITKQKELEQELLEQEEMMIAQSRHVAMGEMIGMIAHQWRQPITVIAMGANNMLADIALEDVNIENFKNESLQILQQTEYLSKTIDDFRTFFRPNKEKDEVKVADIFLEAKQIMGKSLENHNIELVVSDNSNETLLTYSRELLQVVLNLLKNAKEALDANKIHDGYIHVNITSMEDSIGIIVCDNGGGIEETLLERIFEPYFSTKDTKTGTGLGLYISKTIVEKHLHGIIRASNDEKGACFTLLLPKTFQ